MFPSNRILHICLHLCLFKQVPCKPLSHLMQIVNVRLCAISVVFFVFFCLFFLWLEPAQQSFSFFPGNVLIAELVC